MKQLITLIQLCCTVLFLTSAHAQSWQWGQRGGSTDGTVGGGADEHPRDIAVDPNGNVYVLARNVGANGLNIAGTSRTTFGAFDVMLASFTCDGRLRWSKMIGCSREDYGWALQTDKNGGVYFAITAALLSGSGTNTVNFDTDKILTLPNTQNGICYKSVFITKYDTSGNFQWVTAPQADTVGSYAYSNTSVLSIDVDKNGIVHCLSALPTGVFEKSFVVSKQGTYILKYNGNGTFIGGVAPDINVTQASLRTSNLIRDNKFNRYIICGTQEQQSPVYIGGKQLNGGKYIAVFDDVGKVLWYKEDTGAIFLGMGITNRPAIDEVGNIYIAAETRDNNFFNGYTTKSTTSIQPMLMKMDKDGKLIWASNPISTTARIFSDGIALRNSGEVILLGANVGTTKWETYGYRDSMSTPDATYRPFIAKFNTQTGKLLKIDQLVATGNNTFPYDIVGDGRNNVFISGELGSRITVNGNTLASAGGSKDFFVAKYGYADCNCTNIPEPAFSQTVNNHFTYNFNYTGSTANTYDWDFGDGSTSTQQSASHTYTTVGDFIACVKVTNSCGDNIYCQKISTQWPQTVSGLDEHSNVKIYPNPANDVLHVDGVDPGSRIELFDVLGRKSHQIISATEKEIINIQYLPKGNYIIRLTDNNGQRYTGQILKK